MHKAFVTYVMFFQTAINCLLRQVSLEVNPLFSKKRFRSLVIDTLNFPHMGDDVLQLLKFLDTGILL